MEQRLQQMDPKKREKLIRAVIGEFSSLPFEKASTNSIVKRAGISKGLLFHYFKDKQELYDSTARHVITLLVEHIQTHTDWEQRDLFERIRQITFLKIQMERTYPGLFGFIQRVVEPDVRKLNLESAQRVYERLGLDIDIGKLFARVYTEGVDLSLFRDPARLAEYVNLIQWTAEGITKKYYLEYADAPDHLEHLQQDLDTYMGMLRQALYHDRQGG